MHSLPPSPVFHFEAAIEDDLEFSPRFPENRAQHVIVCRAKDLRTLPVSHCIHERACP